MFINTVYSFWWDLTNDWWLDLLQPATVYATLKHPEPHLPALHRVHESEPPFELDAPPRRSHVRHGSVLRAPEKPLPLSTRLYYVFIVVNLLLRFTWSLKLSPHLVYLVEWQRGLLLLEALELVRRCVWVLLRVEWEVVKQHADDL